MKRGKRSGAEATEPQGHAGARVRRERRTSGVVLRMAGDADRVVHELEERLVHAQEALREAERRKDDVLRVLSHELRGPVASLRNSLVILSRTNPASDDARRAHAVMDRQVSHLERLVDDLSEVTRIAKGGGQLRFEPVHLSALVRHTVEDHRVAFTAAGIQVELSIDGTPLWVNGDPARLAQLLGNVLGNAKKFTPAGGRVAVTLSGEGRETNADGADGPIAVLRVRDTGVGIAPREVGRVFEPFSQGAPPVSRPRGGLGLGLAMVKGLVELHQGAVRIESEGVGRGTELTITLPQRSTAVGDDAPSDLRPMRCRRVLIIEDNVDAADTLRDVLTLGRHDVRVAYDARAGLVLAHRFRPEIVICDLGLPEMDGYEVARGFRGDPVLRGVYLVALSAYSQLEDRRRSAAAGFDQHLSKPPNLDALDRLLEEAPALLDIN
jgi:two-component system CheB/CheR fusion protein